MNLFSFGHLDSILIPAGAEINIKVVINDFFNKNVLIIKFGECVVN